MQTLGQLAFTLNFHTSVWKQMTYDVRCYPDTRGQQQVANKHASWLRPGREVVGLDGDTPFCTSDRTCHLQRVGAGTGCCV